MSPSERTLADELNETGYETIWVGKWHLDGGHGRMGSALQCGRTPVRRVNQGRWQRWFGFELRNDPFDTYYFVDDDPTPRPIEGYQTDGLFDLGMEAVRTRDPARPFCLVVSVEPPHDPFVAPPELQQKWDHGEISVPPNFAPPKGRDRAQALRDRRRYAAMVENLDGNLGRMIEFLSAERLAGDTVVVFLADHGELGGAHGLRAKQWPYEESVGIPFIVYDPRGGGGRCIADPVCAEDLFPSILGLAGARPRNPLPGEDLSAVVRGERDGIDREGVLLEFVAEHRAGYPFHDEVWRAFRTERFVYTVLGDKNGARPWQFFDLESDPWQMTDLLDSPAHLGEIERHHRLLARRLEETDDPFVLLPAYGCPGVNTWR